MNGFGLDSQFSVLSCLFRRMTGCLLLFVLAGPQGFSAEAVRDGRLLQAELDAGRDVVLQPGEVYEVTEKLQFRRTGQRISTAGARTASEYARIMMAPGTNGTLIEARSIAGATLDQLVLDGNRPGVRHPEGLLIDEPMLSFGGEGATGQQIRRCIVIGSRCSGGWAAIHVHEGGAGIVIQDNLIFASGTDIRGNGRFLNEKPFGWGDGISTASRETRIVNNLI